MTAYLVRLKQDQHAPHDLVGIFVAESIGQLGELVDECCDTFACEYTPLPSGGIYLSNRAAPVPFGPLADDEDVDFFKGATPSEDWFSMFFREEDPPVWHSLAEAPWKSDAERQKLINSGMAKLIAHHAKVEGA